MEKVRLKPNLTFYFIKYISNVFIGLIHNILFYKNMDA